MIKVFTGPMFSGKSALLVSEYNKMWNKSKVVCFKPENDTRDYGIIKTKNCADGIAAICINDLKEIKKHINKNIKTIFIDEIQFIKGEANNLLDLSLKKGIDVYVAGLNMTSEQECFGIMPYVLSVADEITMVKGICFDCNKLNASYTYYEKNDKSGEILIGDDGYISLCATCLNEREKKKKKKSK